MNNKKIFCVLLFVLILFLFLLTILISDVYLNHHKDNESKYMPPTLLTQERIIKLTDSLKTSGINHIPDCFFLAVSTSWCYACNSLYKKNILSPLYIAVFNEPISLLKNHIMSIQGNNYFESDGSLVKVLKLERITEILDIDRFPYVLLLRRTDDTFQATKIDHFLHQDFSC